MRKAASVLPDPVGAQMSVWCPAAILSSGDFFPAAELRFGGCGETRDEPLLNEGIEIVELHCFFYYTANCGTFVGSGLLG
jgi:hypothetical protein